MGTLENQILSSQTRVIGYTLQPYQAQTPRPVYGVRNWSPELVAPVVDTNLHATAIAGRSTPDIPKVQAAVPGVNFSSGAATVRQNASGVFGGAR